MVISNRTHEEDAAHYAFNDMLPKILEEKIKTCIRDYKEKENRIPNIVILSDKARAVMHSIGLLENFYYVSEGKRRVTLSKDGLKLEVYHIDELTEEKKSEVKEKLSNSSETIYLGRANLLGKLKEKSLRLYGFKCSF